jgi:BlaI family penicillinase repressor
MTEVQLGRIQLLIMQILWEKKKATAREISEALNRIRPFSHNNVQLLLRHLEKKGALHHEVRDRTHIYYPDVMEKKIVHNGLSSLIDTVFGGSVANLVSSLVKDKSVSKKELDTIFEMLDGSDEEE